ncbi:MAG: carboxypeptidase-like regulatory domain-containing protein, partial [Pseudomonadales bacterium]
MLTSKEVTGESLPFVSVVVQGAATGTSTDFEGAFELSGLPPGVVNLSF